MSPLALNSTFSPIGEDPDFLARGKDSLSGISSTRSCDSTELDFWESYSSDPCSTEVSIHLVSPLNLLEARLKISEKARQILKEQNEDLQLDIESLKCYTDLLIEKNDALEATLKKTAEELSFVKSEKSKIRILRRLVYKPISTKIPPDNCLMLDDFWDPPEGKEPVKKSISDGFIRSLVVVVGMFALGLFNKAIKS